MLEMDLQGLADRIPLVTAVERHEVIGSTNARAMEAAVAGAPEGLVVLADAQEAGRGRRGRSWHAPVGTSLLLSILLRPALPLGLWSRLTLMAGTAVRQAIDVACPEVVVGLKWPNDVVVGDHKVAGILAESTGEAVVVGIGLNIDWREVPRPAGLVATSLAEAQGGPVDAAEVLEALLSALSAGYSAALLDPGRIIPAYVPSCVTLGRTVVAHGVAAGRGQAIGLTPDGHLRIRRATGGEVSVSAGEVEHLR